MSRRLQIIDKIMSKLISRKLLVWTVATVALLTGMIDGDNWVQISMIYIGSEAMLSSISSWRAKQNTPLLEDEKGE